MNEIGVNLPERDEVEKLFVEMQSIYEKASKRAKNNHFDYSELFHYLELFTSDEQKRAFFMDRLAELVVQCGETWF